MANRSADIQALFGASTDILTSKLSAIRAAFHHAGMKGAAVEAAIRALLEEILPNNLAVGSGIAIDSDMNVSKQLDIVIYDRASTPTFFNVDGMSLFPIECIYFVIEVKTTLDSKTFEQCVGNMDSVKALTRSAYYKNNGSTATTFSLYRDFETEHWQTIFMVIAMEASSKDAAHQMLEKHRESERPINKQIDSMFVVDTGCFSNHRFVPPKSVGVSILPSNDSIIALNEIDGLLVFLTHFSAYYNQATIGGRFNFTRYMSLPTTSEYSTTTLRTYKILKAALDQGYQFEIGQLGEGQLVKPTLEGG